MPTDVTGSHTCTWKFYKCRQFRHLALLRLTNYVYLHTLLLLFYRLDI
jgi:hypothetical protein